MNGHDVPLKVWMKHKNAQLSLFRGQGRGLNCSMQKWTKGKADNDCQSGELGNR